MPEAASSPGSFSLAADFPVPSRDEWVALVDQVVRRAGRIPEGAEPGAGVETLTTSIPDRIRVRPLYTADGAPGGSIGVPCAAPFVRGSRVRGSVPAGWDVRLRHAEPDSEAAKAAIVDDLRNGVSSIWLAVGDGGTAVADLPAVLACGTCRRTGRRADVLRTCSPTARRSLSS